MSDRNVKVRLSADIDAFIAGLRRARQAVDDLEKGTSSASDGLDDLESSAQDAGKQTEKTGDAAKRAADDVDELGDAAGKTAAETEDLGQSAGRAAAETEDLGQASEKTADSTSRLGRAAQSLSASWGTLAAASQTAEWNRVSTDLLKVGAAATASVAAVSKAAIDWQSDWAGVQKTVDGTTQQMGLLEDQLRGMARAMPATHTEIAAVAEAAGQLGVATDDVAKFSEVMIQLGETTNLSADVAATSIAQFTNIMGTSRSDVDRLGAALVQLGNNGASTEADIMALGHRLAGVGAQMNMTEADVLGMANAMASVGIEAEAGGTAMSLTLKGIDAAVRTGGQELETYARISGMTADQFARAWGQDAAGATATFVEGLGAVSASGGDVNSVLDELGINGIRQADTLIRLAGATQAAGAETDLLRDSLEMGAQAWEQNSALTDEYTQRVETAEAQIQIAWNNIKDAAITAGESTLPAVAGMAGVVADLAQAWGSLPAAVHTAGVGFTAIAAGGLLAAGGIMKAVTAAAEFQNALKGLPAWAQSGAGALGRFGAAVGMAAAGLAVMGAVGGHIQSGMDAHRMSADEAAVAVNRLADAQGSAAMDDSFTVALSGTTQAADGAAQGLSATSTAMKLFTDYAGTGWQAAEDFIMGLAGMKGNVTMVGEELAKLDAALVSMSTEDAAKAFNQLALEAEKSGADINALAVDGFGSYRASLESTAQSMGVYNLNQQELTDWMRGTKPTAVLAAEALAELGVAHVDAGASADDQTAALWANISAMQGKASEALAASNAEIAYENAIARATEAAKAEGIEIDQAAGKISLKTEAGRQAQGTLNQLTGATFANIEAMYASGATTDELTAATLSAREEFVNVATQMGLTGEQANALADEYGLIPQEVITKVSAPGAVASEEETRRFHQAIKDLPADKKTILESIFERQGYQEAVAALNSVQDKTIYITSVYRSYAESQGAVTSTSRRGGHLIASGGPVWGPGTATSDSIPAWLSNGEFVLRASAAQAIGYDVLARMNALGELPRYAAGGAVGARASLPDRLTPHVYQQPPIVTSQVQDAGGLPDRITLVDDSGGILANCRVVAGDVVRTALAPASSGALTSRFGGM